MLAFSNDYYGFIFRATQSVELFCAYAVIGITFISSLIFVTLILGAVYSIEKIGQKRLEKQFDNDEE